MMMIVILTTEILRYAEFEEIYFLNLNYGIIAQ